MSYPGAPLLSKMQFLGDKRTAALACPPPAPGVKRDCRSCEMKSSSDRILEARATHLVQWLDRHSRRPHSVSERMGATPRSTTDSSFLIIQVLGGSR